VYIRGLMLENIQLTNFNYCKINITKLIYINLRQCVVDAVHRN